MPAGQEGPGGGQINAYLHCVHSRSSSLEIQYNVRVKPAAMPLERDCRSHGTIVSTKLQSCDLNKYIENM